MKTRHFAVAALVTAVVGFGGMTTTPASALTVAEIQSQIQALLGQIAAFSMPTSPQYQATITASSPIVTRHRICSALYRNLSRGTRGDDVLALQEFLSNEGYFYANATGYYGPLTAQAVASWQASQGISPVGVVGPITRERIRAWCGSGGGPIACTKEYRPVCGSKPIVCITTPCNPIQQTYGNRCVMQSDGATLLYEGVCGAPTANRPPTISSFSGPTTLNVNLTGTWTVQASDPENGQLTYSITWGDEYYAPVPMASSAAREVFVQTTTFTHTYSSAGTYSVSIAVRDSSGQEARTSSTVRVGSETTYCTMEYAPVCGQPPEPACRYSIPACMMATPGPQTYSNLCMMSAAGATYLYSGECSTGPVACTADAMQCPNGQWVGRTGPNCQFICPTY